VTPRLSRPLLIGVLLVGVLLVTLGLSGCDAAGSSTSNAGPTPATETEEEPAVATPTDLVHPCDVVTGKIASKLLGARVRAKRVEDKMTGRSLDCSYVPAKQMPDAPFLELLSAPDPTPLKAIVGLYLGVDRLRHHPVDVSGASDAEAIFDPDVATSVTVFAKQGFVTHTVVIGIDDVDRAERLAVKAAGLLVAGNPTD
jgi:hypothetical protein